MNTKLLIGGAVVVAVLALVYFVSPKASAPTPEDVGATENQTESTEETQTEGISEETTDASSGDESTEGSATDATPESSTPVTNTAPKPAPKQTVTTPAPAPKLPYSVTVVYDGGRFIPDEITVIEGGTVRFVNVGDVDGTRPQERAE